MKYILLLPILLNTLTYASENNFPRKHVNIKSVKNKQTTHTNGRLISLASALENANSENTVTILNTITVRKVTNAKFSTLQERERIAANTLIAFSRTL